MKYEELTIEEQKIIARAFANWLGEYTDKVVIRVMAKREEILNNEFAINLIKELSRREQEEREDRANSIGWLFTNYEEHKEYGIHNHCLTHAKSYRDVLYDMYIR